jgi:DNA-binding MarR family transcriptional regulator
MPSRLRTAIKQRKPFEGPEHEVFLTLQRLASELGHEVSELLKPHGLSAAQYNVLRILRGTEDDGLACGEIANRLVAKDPDITRLLDRLEDTGLVTRSRSKSDRRVVTAKISSAGGELLATLDEPMAALHKEQLGHLSRDRIRQLLDLLEEAAARG